MTTLSQTMAGTLIAITGAALMRHCQDRLLLNSKRSALAKCTTLFTAMPPHFTLFSTVQIGRSKACQAKSVVTRPSFSSCDLETLVSRNCWLKRVVQHARVSGTCSILRYIGTSINFLRRALFIRIDTRRRADRGGRTEGRGSGNRRTGVRSQH